MRQHSGRFLFGALVAAAALLIWGDWPSVGRNSRDVVSVSDASGSKVELRFHLDEVEDISGTNTQMLKLTASKTKPGLVYSDYEKDTRNILFLTGDEDEKAGRWLFPHQNNVIRDVTQLASQDENEKSPTMKKFVKALFFEYSEKDTSGDGEITRYDRASLGLSKANGEGFVAALKDIDHLYSVSMQGDKTISILYRTGKSLRQARYSAATLTRQSDREIAAIPGVEYRG